MDEVSKACRKNVVQQRCSEPRCETDVATWSPANHETIVVGPTSLVPTMLAVEVGLGVEECQTIIARVLIRWYIVLKLINGCRTIIARVLIRWYIVLKPINGRRTIITRVLIR